MNENSQFRIGSFGRRIIFGGAFMAFMSAFSFLNKWLDRNLSQTVLLCVVFGTMTIGVIAFLYFYERCPKRFAIPIGIVGWLVTFLLLFLRNWF
ncbi:MAG TPA: hypothetical protein VN784_01270 [Candidatus Limnocylindrales bacterium]|nr:hypothetical protein [Candidatus Limnocylindrales bacterium]